MGTSTPEMVVSGLAAAQVNPGLALGNAYGLNITNIALILGMTALIRPITVVWSDCLGKVDFICCKNKFGCKVPGSTQSEVKRNSYALAALGLCGTQEHMMKQQCNAGSTITKIISDMGKAAI